MQAFPWPTLIRNMTLLPHLPDLHLPKVKPFSGMNKDFEPCWWTESRGQVSKSMHHFKTSDTLNSKIQYIVSL